MRVLAYVDGGGVFNDRPANIGVVLIDKDTNEVISEYGEIIGNATNNEAEYTAIISALYTAKELGANEISIRSDSKLVVNQLNGDWDIHKNHLAFYADEVKAQSDSFDSFDIIWIPRSENRQADKLARGCVEE